MKCVAIMGATATGKTAVAVELARRFDGEIVSMDSRQVYRGLDVGTGKATAAEQRAIRHHLIDVLDPTETSSAGRHAALAHQAMAGIAGAGKLPFLVGGTGLYFRALLGGLVDVEIPAATLQRLRAGFEARDTADLLAELRAKDPERAAQLAPSDRVRICRALELIVFTGKRVTELYRDSDVPPSDYDVLKFVLTMARERLRARVAERTRQLFAAGWIDEVRALLDSGVAPDAPAMKSLGYPEIAGAIAAGTDPEDALEAVVTRTRQYAKRQETFFRGEDDAVWIDVGAGDGEAGRRGVVERMARAIAAHLEAQ